MNIITDAAIKYGKQKVELPRNHFLTKNDKLWGEIYSRGFVLKQVLNKA